MLVSTYTDEYNMKLSVKRMNKLAEYFANKRYFRFLEYLIRAYGESKLLNSCGDDAECDRCYAQINRRSELRIILQN